MQRAKPKNAAGIPSSFYWRLGGICFVIGACMETFMYFTGFYDIVTKKEAERYVEGIDRRKELLKQLKDAGVLAELDQGGSSSSSATPQGGQ